jgi:IS5 family transposase
VLDHTLEQGNPADAPQLAPAIERVIARTGRRPRTVTADRGYGEKGIDEALHQTGGRTVVIPRKGRPGKDRRAAEHWPAFRRTVKCADRQRRPDQHPQTRLRIGPDRLDSTEGARIWTGHGILAHNLVKIGALAS